MYGPLQFGFRPGASAAHAHIALHDFVTRCLDSRGTNAVLLISFDMEKAFNKLNYSALFKSLANGRIPKRCLQWMMNYFMHRKQRVILKHNVFSDLLDVTSGVPQGSVLGPFLFAAHLGSFTAVSQFATAFKYADDIIIACPIQRRSSCEAMFSAEMAHMNSWCSSDGLSLNSNKTKTMLVGNVFSPIGDICSFECGSLRFLGMTFNKTLKWDDHIHRTCKLASSRLRMIRILRNHLNSHELRMVYFACVRSLHEYSSEVFVGLNGKNSSRLERLNKRAHRLICGESCRDAPCFLL